MGSSHSLGGPEESPLILFDGVCNLCNAAVQFVIKRDGTAKFRFAALQSSIGRKYLDRFGLKKDVTTIILVKNGQAFEKSSAALEIARDLSGLWPLMYFFKVVPKIIRDAVYDFVARRRYKWFGRKDQCMIPTPALRARFIDS